MADLLFLLYIFCYNICVCMEYSDPPREVSRKPMAEFLRFIFAHFGLLSFPSDILVCFMTFSRLRVIWSVEKQKIRNQPKPIVAQILFAYFMSVLIDVPAFFMYDIKNCTDNINSSVLEGPECWSYVEPGDFMKSPYWDTYVIVKSVVTRLVPALSIICMNCLIIKKLHDIWKKKKNLCCLRDSSNIPNDQNSTKENMISVISKNVSPMKSASKSNFLEVPKPAVNPRRESMKKSKGVYSSLREFRLSVLLVATLLVYTVCTTPKTVVSAIALFNLEYWNEVQPSRLITAICNVFFTFNYSFNFYLYCLANKEIRTTFISLFK